MVPIFDFLRKCFRDFRDHHVWFISSVRQTFWMSTSASILLVIIITMILNGIWVIFIHIRLQTVVPRWAKELMCIVITCLYRIVYLTRHLDYPWNEMFSALLSISKQAFSMQISEPRWNKASYLEANSFFLPGKGLGAGGGVRGGQPPHLLSFTVNKVLVCEKWRQQDWPQITRCIWKKLFQQAQTLASSHT